MGEVCVNYKDYLPIARRDDLCTLQEYLVVEVKSGGKICFLFVFIGIQVKTKTSLNSFLVTLTQAFPILMA